MRVRILNALAVMSIFCGCAKKGGADAEKPSGRIVAVVQADDALEMHGKRLGGPDKGMPRWLLSVETAALSRDGNLALLGYKEGNVGAFLSLWDVEKGDVIAYLPFPRSSIRALAGGLVSESQIPDHRGFGCRGHLLL